MTGDDRPRPEYGEYASESERASAIERSGVPRQAEPVHPVGGAAATSDREAHAPQSSSAIDRIVTIFLLSFGLVSVLGGAGSYVTLEASMDRMFGQLGIGDYTATSLTPIIGILIVASQTAAWIIAAGWSFVRIRRGRTAWWIPVAGGIASFLASAVLLGILLGSDPAFLEFVSSA